MKKRAFLNAENRSVAIEADGKKFDVSAAQTGMAFFKPGEENKEEVKIDNSQSLETSMLILDKPIDY